MLTGLLFFSIALCGATASPIVLDGRFDDWAQTPPVLDDPADAPGAVVDLKHVRITHDSRFVHVLIDVDRPITLQRLDGTIELLLDLDGSPDTGQTVRGMRGVDAVVEMSPRDPQRPGRAGRGAAVSVPMDQPPPGDRLRLSPYVIGFSAAPTHASDRFEDLLDHVDVGCVNSPNFLHAEHAIVAALVLGGRFAVRRVLDHIVGLRDRELFTLCVAFFGIATALVSAAAGFSLAIGAFLAGLIISESEYGLQALSDVLPFRALFSGVFCTSIGMLLDLPFVLSQPLVLVAATLVLILVKSLVAASAVLVPSSIR